MYKILITLVLTLLAIPILAQFNITAGYSLGFAQSGVNNEILNQVNIDNNSLTDYQKMKDIKVLHGFNVGAQYRFEFVSIFGGWNGKVQLTDFNGTDSNEVNQFRELFYRLSSTSLGLEFFPSENISFGGSIDRNILRIRSEVTSRQDRFTVMSEAGLSSHFFVSFNIKGNDILSISLQPYIQVPWTKFDLADLNSELDTDLNLDNYNDSFRNFGIRLVFRNGEQINY